MNSLPILFAIKRFPTKSVKNMPEPSPWTTADVLIVFGIIAVLGVIYWLWKKQK